MELLLKGCIGAVIAVGIVLVSRTRNFFMAGMLPLFPAFGTLAHLIVGYNRGITDLKSTLIFSLYSLIPYFLYLVGTFIALHKGLDVTKSVIVGVVCWFASAIPIILVFKK